MKHSNIDVEGWALPSDAATRAAGIAQNTIKNWQSRFGLFPEKKQGKGHVTSYRFSDVVKMATIQALIDAGIQAQVAVQLVKPYSPYATLLHGGGVSDTPLAQSVFAVSLGQDGNWSAVVSSDDTVVLQVRMWCIFDQVFTRFCEEMRADTGIFSPADIEEIILRDASKYETRRDELYRVATGRIE